MQGGGVPGWSPGDRALQEPAGGLALLVACLTLPFGNPPGRLAFFVAYRPRHPGTEPLAARTDHAIQVPGG